MRFLLLLPILGFCGCLTGEGNRQYVITDQMTNNNYTYIVTTNGVVMTFEQFVQEARSATGRDRSQKADASASASVTK